MLIVKLKTTLWRTQFPRRTEPPGLSAGERSVDDLRQQVLRAVIAGSYRPPANWHGDGPRNATIEFLSSVHAPPNRTREISMKKVMAQGIGAAVLTASLTIGLTLLGRPASRQLEPPAIPATGSMLPLRKWRQSRRRAPVTPKSAWSTKAATTSGTDLRRRKVPGGAWPCRPQARSCRKAIEQDGGAGVHRGSTSVGLNLQGKEERG